MGLRERVFELCRDEHGSIPVPYTGIPCVYYHFNERDEVIYIGQTATFLSRQLAHLSDSPWRYEIASIDYSTVDWDGLLFRNRSHLRAYERSEIEALQPRYNRAFVSAVRGG